MRDKTGYVKHFTDGMSETVWDHLVRKRQASWSHGRLDGLQAVDLHLEDAVVSVSAGCGEWQAADTLVSTYRGSRRKGDTKILKRKIARQITANDVGRHVSYWHYIFAEKYRMFRIKLGHHAVEGAVESRQVKEKHIGRWLVVIVDMEAQTVSLRFDEKRP